MKVIIYATGQLFERYKEKINWSQVVAVADKRVRETGTINSVPLIPAKDLDCFAFDYIAVFSNSLYEEIRMELAGEYFIPEDKIIPWRAVIAGEEAAPAEILKYYKSFCIERRCGKILDMGMAEIPRRCLLKEEFITYAHTGESILDGVKGSGAIQNVNLYDNLYETPKACKNSYDVVFLWDEKQCSEAVLDHVIERTRYILLFTHYLSAGMPVKKGSVRNWNRRERSPAFPHCTGCFGRLIHSIRIVGRIWLFMLLPTKSIMSGQTACTVRCMWAVTVNRDSLWSRKGKT